MKDAVRSVLIVDDEVDACENLRDILVDLGYRTGIARNGLEAIQELRRADYDIALLDLKMPGLDGVSVYREIKRLRPETAAIVVSAFAGSELAETALEEGAAGVVPKPVDVPQLLTAIATSLAQPLVLVVDDDPDFCRNLWQILNGKGFRVALAHDAEEAHRRLAAKSFDIVLIDLRLRGSQTGEDVLRIVAETNPNARRVLVTGFRDSSVETIRSLVDRGIDAVCYKPIDVENLLNMLSRRSNSSDPVNDV
ncbi:MAG TPA: response regulator [Planctomycetaceae bacterium]|nr:response regulator [Planctomycetaceae bacterium]